MLPKRSWNDYCSHNRFTITMRDLKTLKWIDLLSKAQQNVNIIVVHHALLIIIISINENNVKKTIPMN